MPRRYALRVLVLCVLVGFGAFFAIPVIWLVLAPTKTAGQLVHESPIAFGSVSAFVETFRTMISWQGGSLLIWLENSAVYCGAGTAIALVAAIPAGYGLAKTEFVGRRLLLWVTLMVMIMPSSALLLPLFLEMTDLHLIYTAWSRPTA